MKDLVKHYAKWQFCWKWKVVPLSLAEAPAGYSSEKKSNNGAGDDGKGESAFFFP